MPALSAAGVPGILELTKSLDFHIAAGLKPALHSLTLGFAGLGGVNSLGNDAAAVIRDAAFAIQPIGFDAFLDESVQELLAFSGGYIAFVSKRKFKAEFLELTNAILLASLFFMVRQFYAYFPRLSIKFTRADTAFCRLMMHLEHRNIPAGRVLLAGAQCERR